MAEPFTAGVRLDDGGRYVITLEGEIDLVAGPVLRDLVDACVETGATLIVFDLSAVAFFGSTGANLLLRAHHADVEVVVATPSAAALRTIELLGLERAGVVRVDLRGSL